MTEKATGGNITDFTVGSITYRVHTFTESGTFEVLDSDLEVDYLVVGGGGGGGQSAGSGAGGGGGGSGGLLYSASQLVSVGVEYTVTVGGGGGIGPTGTDTTGSNGGNSSFNSEIAIGGGGGGNRNGVGIAGGSGGGGGSRAGGSETGGAGTSGQGNNGGDGGAVLSGPNGAGGGGGAGFAGQDGVFNGYGGAGGDGLENSITGTAIYYAGGGGGGDGGSNVTGSGGLGGGGDAGLSGSSAATAGTTNTGAGGGGAGNSTSSASAGGSGVVIIRYVLQAVDGLDVSSDISVFGDTFTATLTVVDAEDNTTVPYTITGVDSSDIDNFQLTGNFTITDEQGTISFTATPPDKKSFTITANGFTETVDLVENIYGLKQLTAPNSLAFTSEALGVIDLSNVDYALGITILQPDDFAIYNLGASPSVLLELRKFITIDFASKTSFNSSEALDFDPPQYWIGA